MAEQGTGKYVDQSISDKQMISHCPSAGRGGQSSRPGEKNKDRRPGPKTNGGGREHPAKPKHGKEKRLPKSIDEMPKMEESRAKDFSTANKFSFLMEDENDVEEKNGSDENGEKLATERS